MLIRLEEEKNTKIRQWRGYNEFSYQNRLRIMFICRGLHFPNNELMKEDSFQCMIWDGWSCVPSGPLSLANTLYAHTATAHQPVMPTAGHIAAEKETAWLMPPPACTWTLCSLCVEISVERNRGRDTPMICKDFTVRLKEQQPYPLLASCPLPPSQHHDVRATRVLTWSK